MTERPQTVPAWLTERLAAGDLPQERATALRARLEGAGALSELDALRADDVRLLAEHPAAVVIAEVHARAARRRSQLRSRRRAWILPLMAATALSVCAIVVSLRPAVQPTAVPTETVTARGSGARLLVYQKTSDGPKLLEHAGRVRPFDVLQLAYVAAGQRYGVIASVDAMGTVTLHWPQSAGPAAQLIADGRVALPHAFELDATPGFERFVFASADRSFSTDLVLQALRPGGPPLPSTISVHEVRVDKESP